MKKKNYIHKFYVYISINVERPFVFKQLDIRFPYYCHEEICI